MRVWTAFVGGAALAAVAFEEYPRLQERLDGDLGILVGAQMPPGRAELPAWLVRRSRVLGSRRATLLSDAGSVELSFEQLGLRLDVESTLDSARRTARSQTPFSWLFSRLAPSPAITDVPLTFQLDAEQASLCLATLAEGVRREPVDARLDLAAHERVADQPGRELDVAASLVNLAQAERDDGMVVELVTRPIPARITADLLRDVDVAHVLSSYETDFAHHAGARAQNIALAARYLNGAVIRAGEVFSFNRTVGARTVERGFTFAPVIVADELEPGVGGGVCQVASTLHAAAVFGGLDIVQRRNHSRPSGYTPLGLDATVVDGELDLQLKNPYDTPLIVHAFLPTHQTVRVELLGREPPGKVEHFFEIKEKHEFMRKIVVEPSLERNHSERHQKGGLGYEVQSTVRTTYPDGRQRFRSYTSSYDPVPEVFWVGPGTDPAACRHCLKAPRALNRDRQPRRLPASPRLCASRRSALKPGRERATAAHSPCCLHRPIRALLRARSGV